MKSLSLLLVPVLLVGLAAPVEAAAKPRPKPAVGPVGPAGPAGPAGPQGEPGERGPAGPAGLSIVGATGPKGDKGEKGDTGATGPVGPAGPAGADGARGADGASGTSISGGIHFYVAGRCPDGWAQFPGDWVIWSRDGGSSISVYDCTSP